MINRWQGNSGRVQRLPERDEKPREIPRPVTHQNSKGNHAPPRAAPPYRPHKPGGILSGLEGLKKLIPGKAEELETEDIILLLILYLMYRESGDSELLMIMGAMFLL